MSMFWKLVLLILGVVFVLLMVGCKRKFPPNPPVPVPDPDPHFKKWPQIVRTTELWKNYCNYMHKITSDSLVATEMKLYKWISDWDLWNKPDHWALPNIVWKNKKDDCDGLARLSADLLGRFAEILEVHWLEYYGFYRKYSSDGKYKIVAGGHAITVYKKGGKLLAFSNTSWWNYLNFQDFIEIGEQTFPEGLYWVICRHWETGKMEWQLKSPPDEIIEGTNVFHRQLRLIRNLKPLKRGERKKVIAREVIWPETVGWSSGTAPKLSNKKNLN